MTEAAAVLIRLSVKPGHVDAFREHTQALMRAAREEQSCESVQLLQKAGDPVQFLLLEHWSDKDYYLSDAHQKSVHLQAYFEATKSMLEDVGVEMLAPVPLPALPAD